MRPMLESKVARRLSRDVSYAFKHSKRPHWMPESSFNKIMGRLNDDAFMEVSERNTRNRMTGAVDGKARGTSVLGQKSSTETFRSLGPDATPYKLMRKSKLKKDGTWINPRAAEVDAEYLRLEAEAEAISPEDSVADSFAIYQAASGGYDSKHRVFGLGNAAKELLTPPTSSRVSQSSASSYIPTAMSQMSSQNANLQRMVGNMQEELAAERARREEQDRRQALMEAQMRQLHAQLGINFDPNCDPRGPGGPRGPDDDLGGGSGGVGEGIQSLAG